MFTPRNIGIGVAMKLASDGKESNPTGLLGVLVFMAIVFIICRLANAIQNNNLKRRRKRKKLIK